MAKLTAATKKKEPSADFGLPKERKYPMPDASHARNAKARAAQMEKKANSARPTRRRSTLKRIRS